MRKPIIHNVDYGLGARPPAPTQESVSLGLTLLKVGVIGCRIKVVESSTKATGATESGITKTDEPILRVLTLLMSA